MNMEQMANNNDGNLFTANVMQLDLANGFEGGIEAFIEQYASSFREVIEAHPDLLDEYREHPQETLEKIKQTLFH